MRLSPGLLGIAVLGGLLALAPLADISLAASSAPSAGGGGSGGGGARYGASYYTGQIPKPFVKIIDNGDKGFIVNKGWVGPYKGQGYQNDVHFAPKGKGALAAAWSFNNLPAGRYQVAATWSSYVNRATNAPYRIMGSGMPSTTIFVNQRRQPEDFSADGAQWKDLGMVEIKNTTKGTIVVMLNNKADGFVIADAIRIEKVQDEPQCSDTDGGRNVMQKGTITAYFGHETMDTFTDQCQIVTSGSVESGNYGTQYVTSCSGDDCYLGEYFLNETYQRCTGEMQMHRCDNGCFEGACREAPPAPVCGNGIKEASEQCDDGNAQNFDGCTASCSVETALHCADLLPAQSSLVEQCRNAGYDGICFNAFGGGFQGCNKSPRNDCTLTNDNASINVLCATGTASSSSAPSVSSRYSSRPYTGEIPPRPFCGNGIREASEQCDDGNTTDGDGCTSECRTEVPCADSDGGQMPNVAGHVTVGTYQPSDRCDSAYLLEWTCNADQDKVQHHTAGQLLMNGGGPVGEIIFSDFGNKLIVLASNGNAVQFSWRGTKTIVRKGEQRELGNTGFIVRLNKVTKTSVDISTGTRYFSGINLTCANGCFEGACKAAPPAAVTGNLFIREENVPPSRQLLAGKLADSVLRVALCAQHEDIRIDTIRIASSGATAGEIAQLELFRNNETTMFASASPCSSSALVSQLTFCVNLSDDHLVAIKDESVTLTVRPRLNNDALGAHSRKGVKFWMENNSIVATGVQSNNVLLANDGDSIAEGEIFFGRATPGPDSAIHGQPNDIVFAKFSAITNKLPVREMREGPQEEIARFEFTAPVNSNTQEDGANSATLSDLTFTIASTNVAFDDASFRWFRTSNSNVKVPCTKLATGSNGSFTVTCPDTAALDTAVRSGESVSFSLEAGITETAVIPSQGSRLQVSLTNFADRSLESASHVRWSDGEAIFLWIENIDTTVFSALFEGEASGPVCLLTTLPNDVRQFINAGYVTLENACALMGSTATRRDFVRLLVEINGGVLNTPPTVPSFDDVPTSSSYYAHFEDAGKEGWVQGDGSCYGSHPCYVRPSENITISEFAVMAQRGFALPLRNIAPIASDNPTHSPSHAAIQSLIEACVLTPDAQNRVFPESTLRWEEMLSAFFAIDGADTWGVDCGTPPPPVGPVCGNGTKEVGEQCDDRNTVNGDGCSALCTTECTHAQYQGAMNALECTSNGCFYDELAATESTTATCFAEPLSCLDESDQQDDPFVKGRVWALASHAYHARGRIAAYDYCQGSTLQQVSCGADAFVAHSAMTCAHGCSQGICLPPPTPVCGNGTVETGEQCDDRNTVNGDGCSAQCATEEPAISLASVAIVNGNVTVTYGKNFPTCGHLSNHLGQLVHTQNVFCGNGTSVIVAQPLTQVQVTPGQRVRLCHGNNGNFCSAFVTVTGTTAEPATGGSEENASSIQE